ncbi:MAG: hypothetical protein KBT75_14140 [Oleispira antarctica]|nr:hypothetical protein [Oleispira antarctica]
MIASLKTLLKKLFNKEKKALPAFDLVSAGTHPLNVEYSGFSGNVLNIPLAHCRSYLLGYLPQEHPFCSTLKAYNEQPHNYKNSLLAKYYDEFQPQTMADVLKLASSKLSQYPAMATVMPWSYSTPEQRMKRFCVEGGESRLLAKEAYQHGLNPAENFGCQFFGPISDAHGKLEFERLTGVNNKIVKNGYLPAEHGHLHGEFLIDGNDWVWVAIGGKHRFSVLSALDYSEIPVARLSRWAHLYVRRSEVDYWPNVRNGLFSAEEAISVFDRIMKGEKVSSYLEE